MNVDYQDSDSISRALEDANALVNNLSVIAQAGIGLTPKQYRLLSEMVPSLNRLRSVHVKDCVINNRKTSVELETMWNVPKDWVNTFKAIHVPHKRYRYIGIDLNIYAGTNYIAFDSEGTIWAFGIKPEIIDGIWQSRGDSYELTRIQAVPREDWASSLRAVADLEEVVHHDYP
jgi:hypothetical protein